MSVSQGNSYIYIDIDAHICGACLPCGQLSQRVNSQTLFLSIAGRFTCAVRLHTRRFLLYVTAEKGITK